MKNKKKLIILLSCIVVAVIGIVITTILLTKDSSFLNATVVDISSKKTEINEYIINWDSSTTIHDKTASDDTVKCSITVSGETIEYNNFEQGWIAATTTYKNKGELTFTLYDDWIAENGSFGTDEGTKGTSFINGSGGLLIKNWNNNLIFDFNGYKIDRNLSDKSVKYGSVIKVDEGKNIYFKNGCITGGANTDDGGGVLIYGKPYVHFIDMTITGNFSGYNGGGIYVGSHAGAYFNNVTIEGNAAEHYGGGVYCDYKSAPGAIRITQSRGVVKIQNNIGSDDKNNVTLCAASNSYSAQFADVSLEEGSSIYVSFSRKESKVRYVIDSRFVSSSNFKYFHADTSEWVLETTTMLKGGGTFDNVAITYDALALHKK